jgi:thiamine transporter ThiT
MSHALRAALLVVAGSALIGGPFLMGLDAAPLVTGVLVGILAIALGLAGTEPGGRGTLPMSAQAVYDRGLALGLILSAGIFAAACRLEAMVLFAAAGIAALVMTSITRYSARAT